MRALQSIHREGLALCVGCAVLLLAAGFATAAPPNPANAYYLYELTAPQLQTTDAMRLARQFDLVPASDQADPKAPMAFVDRTGSVRMLFENGALQAFPDLTGTPPQAPPSMRAIALAKNFVKGAKFQLRGQPLLVVAGLTTLTTQQGTDDGQQGRAFDVLRSVEFHRQMDGLDLRGPSSKLVVDVGGRGIAGGLVNLRGVGKTRIPVEIISQDEATDLFRRQFPEPNARLVSTELIYFEQGQKYIQPAYKFQAETVGEDGNVTGHVWLVPAVQDTPEPILNEEAGEQPPPYFPEEGGNPGLLDKSGDVYYGRYVVRNDNDGWVVDANAFHSAIQGSNFWARLFLGFPGVVNAQYYWNYPWLWLASPSDYSPYYVRTVDFALIEGHGAPLIISTDGDCCDVINVTDITGYGAYSSLGGRTDYIQWQSCDVVPAPGDPYGGNYQSPATPWTTWFKVFKGMRGTYGYHTTMHIWNGVSGPFASSMGWGVPNLSAWFSSINNGVFHHDNGWNYGSAVLACGHEGDRIYDNSPLPAPGCLTIWWQHP